MIRRIWLSSFRVNISASILLPFLLAKPTSAQPNPTVNRTVPAHSAPNAGFVLSANPSEQEIRQVRLFAEPLVPTGSVPSAEENRQVAEALRQHVQRTIADDFSALEQFVAAHPESPWTPALLFN